MPARRTVDPTGEQASSKMIALRMTAQQMEQVAVLCQKYECSRSTLFRHLLAKEMNND
jgi:hypothetical protein